MRLPKITELNEEQMNVFNAPLSDTILVIGPPGSGKTVLAFFRAEALRRSRKDCKVLMYNQVLNRYTQNKDLPEIETSTLLSWLPKWWNKATGTNMPRRPAEPGKYQPPDFTEMTNSLIVCEPSSSMNWGHIIIDEAQDFAPEFYAMLSACRLVKFSALPRNEQPSMTILADENQRITQDNSTINNIKSLSQIVNESVYHLKENYRNTKQIADFANEFYVGLVSGKTDPPERNGEKPRVTRVESMSEVCDRVVKHVNQHEDEEIGIFVQARSQVEEYHSELQRRFAERSQIRIQGYASGDKNELTAKNLEFDRPGTITIVCDKSVKGLEFDTVFMPELQAMRRDESNQEIAKMQLYVCCTRARRSLRLFYQGTDFRNNGVGRWIPGPETDLATWD